MVILTYTTVKGNTTTSYAQALAEGGVKNYHYEPIKEAKPKLTPKREAMRIKLA